MDVASFGTSSRKPTPESRPGAGKNTVPVGASKAGLPVVVLGQVGDERHGNTHVDTCPDGD